MTHVLTRDRKAGGTATLYIEQDKDGQSWLCSTADDAEPQWLRSQEDVDAAVLAHQAD